MKEKDFEQVVLQGLEYESIEKEKAAERKALTRKYGLKPEDAKYSQDTQGQTRDIVAEKLGISGKHWDHMKFVYQHKDNLSDEEYQDWKQGKVTTSKLYNQLCKTFKYTEVMSSIIESMSELEDEIIRYKESYTDADTKHKLSNTLYSCKEETKDTINDSFNRIMEEKRNFTKKQWGMMVQLRGELEQLRDKMLKK